MFNPIRTPACLMALVSCLAIGCAIEVQNPDEVDGLEQGLACNLTGAWGVKLNTAAAWDATSAIAKGTGVIEDWFLVNRTQSGSTITDTTQLCGERLPDFYSAPGIPAEKYGLAHANALFDHVPPYVATSTVSASGTLETGSPLSEPDEAGQLGVAMTNPLTDAWPPASARLTDTDHDAKNGVTLRPISGAGYSNPIVNLFPRVRVGDVYAARRLVFSLNGGTINSCSKISGSAFVSKQDRQTLGCTTSTGSQCSPAQAQALQATIPTWRVTSAAFVALKFSVPATCALVRSALYSAPPAGGGGSGGGSPF